MDIFCLSDGQHAVNADRKLRAAAFFGFDHDLGSVFVEDVFGDIETQSRSVGPHLHGDPAAIHLAKEIREIFLRHTDAAVFYGDIDKLIRQGHG